MKELGDARLKELGLKVKNGKVVVIHFPCNHCGKVFRTKIGRGVHTAKCRKERNVYSE